MYEKFGDLEASVQEKVDGDSEFQGTLTDLSDEDKETAIKTRKSELLDEEIKTLGEKSKKNEELATNYKTRAEKAEKLAKEKPTAGEPTSSELSFKDQLALTNAKIHEDDLDEVVEYAKFKKITVSEALKSNVIKSSLAEKEEVRKSAEATNTTPVRRGAVAPSNTDVLDKAMKGDIPEPGSPEALQLWKARRGIK